MVRVRVRVRVRVKVRVRVRADATGRLTCPVAAAAYGLVRGSG